MINWLWAAGGHKSAPSNPINVFLITGQSNADQSTVGNGLAIMSAFGISNPGFSECPVLGNAFRNWWSANAFQNWSTDGTENPETPVAVTSLTRSGATATLETAAAAIGSWRATSYCLVAGADQAQYNGFHLINTSNNNNSITFAVDDSAATTATGTITVRRAGFRELFLSDIEQLAASGEYINVIGMGWMQGEGNSDNNNLSGEYSQFADFLLNTYEWLHEKLGAATNTTIDRNFVIAVGLTGLRGDGTSSATNTASIYVAEEAAAVRNYQKRACDRRDWAYWVETLDISRPSDGIHCSPENLYPRLLTAITERRNVRGAE